MRAGGKDPVPFRQRKHIAALVSTCQHGLKLHVEASKAAYCSDFLDEEVFQTELTCLDRLSALLLSQGHD